MDFSLFVSAKTNLAVIDTNVFVSGLISKNSNSPPSIILDLVLNREIITIYIQEILSEYEEVLSRERLKIPAPKIDELLIAIDEGGVEIQPQKSLIPLIDDDDLPFYEAILDTYKAGAYLITGNLKHFPSDEFVVSPREFLTVFQNYQI